MAIFPKVVCRRCKHEYPAIYNRCPKCGARKAAPVNRAAVPTDAQVPETAAYRSAPVNARWQNVFGGVILAVVIIAVITLVSLALQSRDNPVPTPSPTTSVSPLPSPSVKPSPTPSPTPEVISITITFLGNAVAEEGFTIHAGNPVKLGYMLYPVTTTAPVTWSSSDDSIISVDSTGLVTFVSNGTAYVIISCGGIEQACKVIAW